jgi:hypothetical protein
LQIKKGVTLISLEILLNPLLWNEYDRGYLITHLLVEVEVISPKFWVLPLSSSQIEKYNFIKEKRIQGFYYHQISVMMNESHFKPQRTLKFTPQQVWGLEFKLEKRLKRLDKIENPRVVSIGLINEV